MVKITYKPWDEIIIHEAIEYSAEELVRLVSVGVPPGGIGHSLLWANGIAFKHEALPQVSEVVREQLEGRLHWAYVMFAAMPQCRDYIIIEETNVRIPIINVSNNPVLRETAEWMRQQLQK